FPRPPGRLKRLHFPTRRPTPKPERRLEKKFRAEPNGPARVNPLPNRKSKNPLHQSTRLNREAPIRIHTPTQTTERPAITRVAAMNGAFSDTPNIRPASQAIPVIIARTVRKPIW